MGNAVWRRRLLHSLPQDEIIRLGAKKTAADARQAAPGATPGP